MDMDAVIRFLREKFKKSKSSNVGPKIINFERVVGSSNKIRCVMDNRTELAFIVIEKNDTIYLQGPTEGWLTSLEEFIGKSG